MRSASPYVKPPLYVCRCANEEQTTATGASWGTDITGMQCSWRHCVTLFTEELP
jgi:hypothetical protein